MQQEEDAIGVDLLLGQRRRSSVGRRSSNSSASSDGRQSPFGARSSSAEPPDAPLLQHGPRVMSEGAHFLHHDLTQAVSATMLCTVLQRVHLTLIEPDSYTYENSATLPVDGGLEVDVSNRVFRAMRPMHTIAEELDDSIVKQSEPKRRHSWGD